VPERGERTGFVKTDAVPELVQRMTTGQLGPLLQEACERIQRFCGNLR